MIVIEKAKALALKLKNPSKVLNTIPTAKPLSVRGTDLVVLPHRLDEVKVLANMGIKAPSPIEHYYGFPGRYTPYDHQRETAAFLTKIRRGFVLNEIGCVDADTEYLSPTGWKRIADYTGGAVAQYHPETGKVDFVDEPEFVKLPCPEMIRIKTTYGVDQLLSPEHRVLYVSPTGKPMVRQAHEILTAHQRSERGWSGRFITTFDTPGGVGIPLSDAQLRVQVALMVDGYFAPEAAAGKVVLRLKKARKQQRLTKLLVDAGIPFKAVRCTPEGFMRYTFQAPLQSKTYGTWAWDATPEQLRVICDEVPHWDGTTRKAGAVEFFTRDKPSADFIQYAFSATGRTASLTSHLSHGGVDYVVHARAKAALLYAKGYGKSGKSETMWVEPSPDGFKYCFMVPSTFLVLRRNGCVFATGNTGKTQSALWAADYLIEVGAVKRVLIMSPLSTLERVWGDAIYTGFPNRDFVVLHGSAAKRRKLMSVDVDFYIINHDGFPIIFDDAHDFFDLVIVDEAAVYRNASTQRFKVFNKFLKRNPNVLLWLMTGTPTPNEPTDAWALAKLAESPNLPTSFTKFKDMVMRKIGQWKWIPREEAVDVVKHILQPAVRFTRDECFDLPETIIQTRQAPLSKQQDEVYKQMLKQFITELKQEAADKGRVTAANEAVKAMKLMQIACGVVYDDEGNNIELDYGPRLKAIKEVIEEAGEKIIIFVPLTGALRSLERELSKEWTVGVVNGEVSSTKRNEIFQNFQHAKDPHILIAHPGTMSHGLTLTSASTIIWAGPINSNEQYVQANGRVERIGKRTVSNVVHIESTELERKAYKRLQAKQTMQGILLDLIQSEIRSS